MDDIDDALSYAKYNFEGVIAGFRVQKKERLKEENKRKDKKPEEFKHLTLFAAQHLSDEIKNYCHAYGDYNHATVWAASFLNDMVSECKQHNFENFISKDEIPLKTLMEKACEVLSDDVMDVHVSCKAHFHERNADPYFEIILKY